MLVAVLFEDVSGRVAGSQLLSHAPPVRNRQHRERNQLDRGGHGPLLLTTCRPSKKAAAAACGRAPTSLALYRHLLARVRRVATTLRKRGSSKYGRSGQESSAVRGT